ncbi:Holliday junction resolvase RuvX, partial [bacterium]|nr:Holliday junction resolvase RuvX [bacterium]
MMISGTDTKSYLAIDYGRRRVGIAGCSGDVSIAFGITTLAINGLTDLFNQLQPFLDDRSVTNVVLGFPITLGDKPGMLKSEVLAVAEKLQERGYTVHLVDEA